MFRPEASLSSACARRPDFGRWNAFCPESRPLTTSHFIPGSKCSDGRGGSFAAETLMTPRKTGRSVFTWQNVLLWELHTAERWRHVAGKHFWGGDLQSNGGRIDPVIDPQRQYRYQTDTGGDGIDTDLWGRIAKSSPSVFRERRDVLQLRWERSFFFAQLTCFWNNKKSYNSIMWVEICTKVTQKLTNSRYIFFFFFGKEHIFHTHRNFWGINRNGFDGKPWHAFCLQWSFLSDIKQLSLHVFLWFVPIKHYTLHKKTPTATYN